MSKYKQAEEFKCCICGKELKVFYKLAIGKTCTDGKCYQEALDRMIKQKSEIK